MAPVAVPPQLQGSHQAGEEEANGQDAEDPSEAVQLEGFAVGLGTGVAGEVTAAHVRPPLLLEHVQVASVLQLQDPARYNPREPQPLASSVCSWRPWPFPHHAGPFTDHAEPW